MGDIITLAHGSGGKLTHNLISQIFKKHFDNELLKQGDDSAVFNIERGRMAYTTDSYVITPYFFNGGDIGKLSVCGTVNDLSCSGAVPYYISCGFIIEEGFEIENLDKIASSMAETAKKCGAKIVTGDTKVVPKGAADGIFINTSGIGFIADGVNISGSNAKSGDSVIVSGTLGDHGCAIMLQRENLNMGAEISSDCAPLNSLVQNLIGEGIELHVVRDATRGGLATTLNEIASQSNVDIKLYEDSIPVKPQVTGICELLGLDPLYLANEGKMIFILPKSQEERALNILRNSEYGKNSAVIGEVLSSDTRKVYMQTYIGGTRIIDMLVGDQLPRIC